MILHGKCDICASNLDFDEVDLGSTVPCPTCERPTKLWVPTLRRIKSGSGIVTKIALLFLAPLLIAVVIIHFMRSDSSGNFSALAASTIQVVIALGTISGVLCIYFVPAYVGRHKQNATAILVLNIFLGWTFIGWVGALVWALTNDVPPIQRQ